MRTLKRDGELGIGERKIDDGGQPLALKFIGDKMNNDLDDSQHAHRNPERLAADTAVKAVKEIGPIHRCYAA